MSNRTASRHRLQGKEFYGHELYVTTKTRKEASQGFLEFIADTSLSEL